jgi:hypothetical protein
VEVEGVRRVTTQGRVGYASTFGKSTMSNANKGDFKSAFFSLWARFKGEEKMEVA